MARVLITPAGWPQDPCLVGVEDISEQAVRPRQGRSNKGESHLCAHTAWSRSEISRTLGHRGFTVQNLGITSFTIFKQKRRTR
jgi:hypothetical protein